MIWFSENKDIDKKKWDQCIQQAPSGMVYALSWYLDRVCKNWKALIEDDYVTVFPLISGRKYGIRYLYQPYFAQQLGIFSKKSLDSITINRFINSIPKAYKLIEISLNSSNQFHLKNFKIKNNTTFELDLNSSYQNLTGQYSTNTKRNITKAVKKQVVIKKESNVEELIGLFRKNLGSVLKEIRTTHYNNLRSVMLEGLTRELGEIYAAYGPKGDYCAGAYFLFSLRRFVFLFSASSRESRENGAMFLIVDKFIKEKAGNNYLLDFQGSNIEGLARFYRGFGSKPNIYSSISRNNLPWPIRMLK
jgi:hypothetical protein